MNKVKVDKIMEEVLTEIELDDAKEHVIEHKDYYEFINSQWIEDCIANQDWVALNPTMNTLCALQNTVEQLEQLSTGILTNERTDQ